MLLVLGCEIMVVDDGWWWGGEELRLKLMVGEVAELVR